MGKAFLSTTHLGFVVYIHFVSSAGRRLWPDEYPTVNIPNVSTPGDHLTQVTAGSGFTVYDKISLQAFYSVLPRINAIAVWIYCLIQVLIKFPKILCTKMEMGEANTQKCANRIFLHKTNLNNCTQTPHTNRKRCLLPC